MKRHEVSEEEWAILDPLLPQSVATTGRPPRDRRQMLNGILWILSTGSQWRDLAERFGPWQTVYGYFRDWQGGGVFDSILAALHVRLDREGKIDWDLWCIDGTSIRGTRSAAGASKKYQDPSRGTCGPRFGPFARRFWQQNPPPRRRQRHAARSRCDGGPGTRFPASRTRVEEGARAAEARTAEEPSEAVSGRQGL